MFLLFSSEKCEDGRDSIFLVNPSSKLPSRPSVTVLQKGTAVEETWIQILTLTEHLTLGKVTMRVMDYISVFNWFIRAPWQGSETLTHTHSERFYL